MESKARRDDAAMAMLDAPPHIRWDLVVALFAVAMVARFVYFYFDDLSRHMTGTFDRRLLEETTGIAAAIALFPLAVLLERRFPLDLNRWRRNAGIHVAGFVVYSILHTTLMAVQRGVLFPLLGRGPYDFGDMPMRFLTEGGQDVFSYATFVGLLTLIRGQQRARAEALRAARMERAAAEARLESLSLRLQPHFLFNALNTISSVVYDDASRADELIGRLGELLRRSLATTDKQETSLADELEVLEAYEALIEARFGDRGRFAHDIDRAALLCAVPAFLLQPLVENAVRHGSSREDPHSLTTVRAHRAGPSLVIVLENDIDIGDEPMRLGVGLGATIDRLRLLYGNAARLDTAVTEGRFRVTISLPARAIESRDVMQNAEYARAHR